MSTIAHRIHLGIMGDALCHATGGWFCVEVLTHVVDFSVRLGRLISFELGR